VRTRILFAIHPGRMARTCGVFVCAIAWMNCSARAGVNAYGMATPDGKSTATTEEQPEEPKNWIELGIGGVITNGNTAQFEQAHHLPGDQVYGGIQDMHYEQNVGKDGTLTFDGHALWDINDYDIKVQLAKPKLGYISVGFTEFRTWYDGNGGFLPPKGGTWIAPLYPEMHIDRGEIWVELGLRVPDLPEVTFRYTREFRDGQKDSTSWGDTNLTGLAVSNSKKIVPSLRDIDETRDIVTLDISKTFGNTDLLLGMRYEHIDDQDDFKNIRGAGQLPPTVPPPGQQRFVTQHNNDDIDLFSGHVITESRLTDSLWFTAGYSYTTMENDTSGSRIFGTHFDSAAGEPIPTLGQRDHSYIDLSGMAEIKYHVFDANLFWMPLENLTVLSGFRYTHESQDTDSTFLALEPVANVPPPGFHYGPPSPVSGERTSDYDRFAERVEVRYTGMKDWLFYAEGEWEEESGHVFEVQQDEEEPLDKDTDFLGQKYTIGATWYPTARLSMAGQYYHKIASYSNDLFHAAGQRLLSQDWNTDNFNIRITFRPKMPVSLGTLVLVTRYDFRHTDIDGQWALDTEPLKEEQTGEIRKHVITESITWNPLARLFLQADASIVLNETDTPASQIVLSPFTGPTVLNFRNDYWTVSAGAGYVIDDKTDVHVDYSFYRANDYVNNTPAAVPYGMGATEHTVGATISRQLTKKVRLSLRYTYYNYTDETFGGHNDFEAHSIFSSLQFRF
jgi:hypothetical protein